MGFNLVGAATGAQKVATQQHDDLERLLAQAFRQKQVEDEMALRQRAQTMQESESTANQQYRQGQVARQGRLDDVAAGERRQVDNQRGVSRMMGDFLMQRGSTPLDQGARNQLSGMAVSEGVDLPRGLLDAPSSDSFTLAPGSKRFGPDGKEIASAPPTPAQPRDERLVQVAGPQGAPTWVRESDAVNKPAAQAPRAVTGSERQVLAYYNRAKDASETIARPDATGSALEDRVSKSGLATQLGLQYAPNMLQTSDQQAYRQAQRSFTEARLRKESGAAIPTAEYENDAQTYFAQPGDSPDTVEQKRKSRLVVLDGLKFSAGKAYQEFYGDEAQAAPPSGQTATIQKWGRDAQGKPVRLK